jgi:hypothetical protein
MKYLSLPFLWHDYRVSVSHLLLPLPNLEIFLKPIYFYPADIQFKFLIYPFLADILNLIYPPNIGLLIVWDPYIDNKQGIHYLYEYWYWRTYESRMTCSNTNFIPVPVPVPVSYGTRGYIQNIPALYQYQNQAYTFLLRGKNLPGTP